VFEKTRTFIQLPKNTFYHNACRPITTNSSLFSRGYHKALRYLQTTGQSTKKKLLYFANLCCTMSSQTIASSTFDFEQID